MAVNWDMASSPLQGMSQGLATLQQTLQNRQQMEQQNSLHALQMQQQQIALDEAKRGQTLQTGLETRLAALPGTTKFVANGPLPKLASLGQGIGETMSDANPNVFNTPGSIVTTPPSSLDRAKEAANYYSEKGAWKEAAGAVNLTKSLAEQAAHERAYGSPEKAAEIDAKVNKMTQATTLYSGWKKAGGKAYADQQAARMPELFGEIDLSKIQDKGTINTHTLANGQQVVWSDDNPGAIHLSAAPPIPKPAKSVERTVDLGDKVEYIYTDGTKEVKPKGKLPAAAGAEGPVAQSTFVDPKTGKPLVFDKATGTYKIAKVEGDGGVTAKPNPMSPEAATRAQQFDTVVANVPKIREMVFDKNGEVNRIDVANSGIGTPFTKGREIRQMVKRTVEQVLRIATGAAAPDSEVANYLNMYAPQIGDTKEMIEEKLTALSAFAEGAREKYNIGRSPQAITQPGNKSAPSKGKPINATTAQGFLRKAGGNKDKARELAKQAGYSF